MTYEIPQELQYQEKIIFGLTFQQLMYAVIFSPLAIALLFKTPFPLYIRISLALIPSGLAGVFMFTSIPKQLKNWIKWLTWQKIDIDHPKMRQFLEVEKIEGDIIQLK